MIEVNITELKNNINNLNGLIDEYEEIQLNLFNQLKDSCINWQDGNSIAFDEKMYLEKQESNLLLQNLRNQKKIYNLIYDKYSELGNKIRCNLNNKTTLLKVIDNCYNQASQIINEFNLIDRSFYYYEQYSISNQREKIVDTRNKLSEIKTTTYEIYDKIEQIEEEINAKIKELETIKINSFDFNLV